MKTFKIEVITDKDSDDVIEFLKRNFFQDSPMSLSLQVDANNQERINYFLDMMHHNQGLAFKAVSTINGRILGIMVNDHFYSTDALVSKTPRIEYENWKELQSFIKYVDSQFDMWAAYPGTCHCFEANILSVDPSARGMGIATALSQRSLDYARANGYELIKMVCTSKYSAMLCERLGYDKCFTMRTDVYRVNGNIVMRPNPPHDETSIYIKRLK